MPSSSRIRPHADSAHPNRNGKGASVLTAPPKTVPSDRPVDDGPASTPSIPISRWWVLAIYVVGVLILGVSQLGTQDQEMGHDTAHYLSLARSVARGEEFATKTHWALNMPGDGLPRPDTYRAPLYPMLVAAASFVVSDLHAAAKWVTVLCGAGIPLLVFFFVRRRLRLSVPWSLAGVAVALTHHHLVLAGTHALTEAPYALVALVLLYVLTGSRPSATATGVLVGLACLLRYQGITLIPIAAVGLFFSAADRGQRLRGLGIFAAVLTITLAPWLARTYQITGSLFYTDLKYHLTASYDPDVPYYEYFHSAGTPREPLGYFAESFDRTLFAVGYRLREIGSFFWRENGGNPLLLAFAMIGLGAALWGRGPLRPGRRTALLVSMFVVVNVSVVALTFAKSRHLTSVDPFVAVFAAFGAACLLSFRYGSRRGVATAAVLGVLGLGIALEAVRSVRKLERYEPTGYEAAERLVPYLHEHLKPGESVMAASPFYFSYLLDRQSVSLPWCDDDLLKSLIDRYRVRFVYDAPKNAEIPSRCDEGVLGSDPLPAWLAVIPSESSESGRLLEVDLSSVR